MNMVKGLKNKILELRRKGYSYRDIEKKLNCSRSIISYHSHKNGLITEQNFLDEKIIEQIKDYYKSNTVKNTAEKFNISESSVKYYGNKKRKILTDEERKKRNYLNLKSQRDKIKIKAVEYKGGKCCKCGYNKSIWALEFHHIIKEEKEFSLSRFGYLAWNKVKKEIDKCLLVCSNCHRELHEIEHKDINLYNETITNLVT